MLWNAAAADSSLGSPERVPDLFARGLHPVSQKLRAGRAFGCPGSVTLGVSAPGGEGGAPAVRFEPAAGA